MKTPEQQFIQELLERFQNWEEASTTPTISGYVEHSNLPHRVVMAMATLTEFADSNITMQKEVQAEIDKINKEK